MRTAILVPSSVAFCSPTLWSSFSKALIESPKTRAATCATPRFSSVQTRARLIESSERRTQVMSIEAKLRSLGAQYAADQAHCLLATKAFDIPETWPALLSVLNEHGITNLTLSRITSKLGVVKLLNVSPASASNLFHLFGKSLMLSTDQQKQILSTKPGILDMDVNLISATLQVLFEDGMRFKDVKRVVLRRPHILLLHPTSISRLAKFLQSSPLSLPDYKVRSLLRRSPWIFTIDIDTYMAPSIDWLTEYVIQPSRKPVLAKLILSAPALLGTKRASLHSVMRLLEHEAYLKAKDRVSVVNSLPRILTCSPEKQLRPVLSFLRNTLQLRYYELRKIVRAFPYILTLDVDQQLIPVVDFFTQRGVSDVSRLVTRFPPILGNDLQNETLPTVEYLIHELGLTMDEILKFPASFSYDLATRIVPRTQFIQKRGGSVREIGLSRILSPSDAEFCQFLQVQLHFYISFCEARMGAFNESILPEQLESAKRVGKGI